jgi:hypothetical protein
MLEGIIRIRPAVPYTKQIADMDRDIEALTVAISALRRAKGKPPGEMDRMLAEMARLKARRTRFMLRQRMFVKQQTSG